jgi:hypothetical protein
MPAASAIAVSTTQLARRRSPKTNEMSGGTVKNEPIRPRNSMNCPIRSGES